MADSYMTVVDVQTGEHKKIKLVDNSDGTFSIASTAVISSADVQVDTDELEARIGATDAAAVAAGAAGALTAQMRRLTTDLDALKTQLAAGQPLLASATVGGLSTYKTIDLDETEEEVKATAGQVYGCLFFNLHATDTRYIKFYKDTAANVIVGTTVPDLTIPIKAGQSGGFMIPIGMTFAAICIAATTAAADADSGAPGANEVMGFVLFK